MTTTAAPLETWARRHGVSAAALAELRDVLTAPRTDPDATPPRGKSEAAAQAAVRMEASEKGMRVFRNNVGGCVDQRGRHIRYGLANDSKQLNKRIKSADLIGIRPVLIGPEHVGSVIGQFVSREIKRPGWHYTGTERERAQLAWAELILGLGGDAGFADGPGTL